MGHGVAELLDSKSNVGLVLISADRKLHKVVSVRVVIVGDEA
jgi:hypothetical protein